MRSPQRIGSLAALALTAALGGCASPHRADQGALIGGLGGAGVGALVGEAVDQPLAGAAIGGVVGALSGSMIGGSLDEIEARNRAEIEARLGRPAPMGAATVQDVVAMTQSGVSEDVIITHVRNHGVAQTLAANDLIYLQNQGVSPRVVQAMQVPVASAAPPAMIVRGTPPPVIVEEHYYDPWGPPPPPYWHGPPPCWHGPPRRWRHGHRHRHEPRVGFGISISN